MKRILNFAVVAMSAVIMTSSRADAAVVNVTEGSTSGYTMMDGNTYVIQNSVSFSNSTAGGSGMSVEEGATVVIYVPTGVTLTATGTNGSGRTGGGAGIRVPETATLIITGEGTVNATGGNAGNGGNGANGEKGGTIQSSSGSGKGYGGAGGMGGAGGGGAGSGIGGVGGNGGGGGLGAERVGRSSYTSVSSFCIKNGNKGKNGEAGSIAGAMGNVYCIGLIDVIGQSGNSGVRGSAGGRGAVTTKKDGSSYSFATCGGGGGGGGGAGAAASLGIGSGGRSGGGGGGGGGGPIDAYYYYELKNAVYGGGGSGGMSAISAGASGSAATSAECIYNYVYGGDGGAGGAAGAEGGAGTLYVSPTATVNVERDKLSATTHSAAQYTITFDVDGGQFSSTIESLTATLGCELPDCIPTPIRSGYLFEGWRTAANEEYYGASGTKSISSYPVADDVVLCAQWSEIVDHTVTTPAPVPYLYFESDYPALLAEHGGDYESAANATALNGRNKVWECYVAGISPTNASASFLATIEIGKDGSPEVKWTPDLNENGTKSVRTYTVEGKMELTGEWGPTNANSRFFRVKVELPK